MTDTQVTWLTQESYDRLKAELDQLIANRPVIAAEINDRREEGDLRENGGYHAAREEQGQQEARIRQLQELLNTAKVGEAPKQSGVALPGSVVKVYYNGDKSDTETFLIATRQEGVVHDKLEVYSPNSPLGGALLNAKVGETRELHRAQRQDRKGHAGQRRALPRLGTLARTAVAHIAEDLLLLLLDNAAAQPATRADQAAEARWRPLSSWTWPTTAGCGPRSPMSRYHRANWWHWRVPHLDPVVRPALALLSQAPIAPAAAIAKLSKRAEDDVLDQLLRTGQMHQIQLTSHRFSHNNYAWPMANRARVDRARSAVLAALFDQQRPDPPTAAIISLLHSADAMGTLLSLNDRGWHWVQGRAGEIASGNGLTTPR